MTTPNINNLLALPFKRRPIESREEFIPVWSTTKEYVRSVGGQRGSYQANKAERLSEEFSWPKSPAGQTGKLSFSSGKAT